MASDAIKFSKGNHPAYDAGWNACLLASLWKADAREARQPHNGTDNETLKRARYWRWGWDDCTDHYREMARHATV